MVLHSLVFYVVKLGSMVYMYMSKWYVVYNVPVSQIGSVYPGAHTQEKVPSILLQDPPFAHGLDSHSSTSLEQSVPV